MKIRDMIMKDFRIALSDRAVIIELIIMPIILMTILGLSLTFSFADFSNMEMVKIAVVKEYNIEEEKNNLKSLIPQNSNIDLDEINFGDFDIEMTFFEDFLGNKELKEIIEYEILGKDDAIRKLENKEITAIVILPKGFVKNTFVNFGTSFRNVVDISVIGRTDKNIGTTIVEEIMKGFTDILNYNISAKNSFIRIYNREEIDGDITDHIKPIMDRISNVLETKRPDLKYESLNNRPPMNSKVYYAFAMTAMFILFGAGYGSKFLLEEKNMGTYDRMSASGVKKSSIVVGKAATIFLVVLVQMLLTYGYSTLVLKVDWGPIYNIGVIFISSAFSVAGLGIMLAALVYSLGSYNIANLFSSFLIQVMAVLGGSMIPIEVFPSFARLASNLTPNGLMLKALMKNYYGYELNSFLGYIISLFIFGFIFMVIAAYLLKREGRRGNYVKHIDAKANAV